MREAIMTKLNEIEEENDVKILYAVEAGSRGWGFESTDSDYDVRFIYIHKPEWYLSIQEKRDVIELPINDLLDISGWDIRKSLILYKKSNPTLLEWLSSPIIYMKDVAFVDELKILSEEYFSSKSCVYHYLHMAEGNYREYVKRDIVRIKKYFYMLRPIMACMWVDKYGTQPPMLFEELMNALELDSELVNEIEKLLIQKKAGIEMREEYKNIILNRFLEYQMLHFNELVKTLNSTSNGGIEELDKLFRKTLEEAWE